MKKITVLAFLFASAFMSAQDMEVIKGDFSFLKDQKDQKNYEAMDQTGTVDEHFFKGDKFTTEGQEFLDQINGYRDAIIKLIGEKSPLATTIKNRFDTSPQDAKGGKQLAGKASNVPI